MTDCNSVKIEAMAIAEFQEIADTYFCNSLRSVSKHFSTYAEFVLTEHGMEIITATKGDADSLSKTAEVCESSPIVIDTFLKCAKEFPDVVYGLKICYGPGSDKPSLYIRVKTPNIKAVKFLYSIPWTAELLPKIKEWIDRHNITYYLSFKGKNEDPCLKTYHIGNVDQENIGFVSYRISKNTSPKIKNHLTKLQWDKVKMPNDKWEKIAEFAKNELKYKEISYFGILEHNNQRTEFKMYIERIGAIPTDYSAK